jgi:hypothetical protein
MEHTAEAILMITMSVGREYPAKRIVSSFQSGAPLTANLTAQPPDHWRIGRHSADSRTSQSLSERAASNGHRPVGLLICGFSVRCRGGSYPTQSITCDDRVSRAKNSLRIVHRCRICALGFRMARRPHLLSTSRQAATHPSHSRMAT